MTLPEHSNTLQPMAPVDLADDAIGLFLEYRYSYGYDEQRARAAALREVAEAEQAREESGGWCS